MVDKRVVLIKRLLHRTENGGMTWEPTARENEFLSSFSGYTVSIGSRRTSPGDPDLVFSIYNADGSLVEEFDDTDLPADNDFDPYVTMGRLHEMARRYAMGAEQALDSLLNELDDRDIDDLPF
ncbi:MAG TPA: hypothetical protein VF625_00075 [Longimicrobium sp.]|jgi:hypothetical protein